MNRTAWSASVALAVWVTLGAGALGCGSDQQPAQAPATATGTEEGQLAAGVAPAEDDQDSQDLKAHHRHHHGGFVHYVLLAIDTLGVTPDQQAKVDAIKADLHAKMQPVRDAQKGVLLALADGVAAGNVDAAKVDAAIAGVSTAAGQVHSATKDALNQLHAVLRPEQRAALVDKMEAHWAVWKDANGDEKAAAHEHEPGGHIAHLAKEIGLSPDQVEKLKASFPAAMTAQSQRAHFDPAAAEAHLKAFGTAFQADTFDAASLAAGAPAHGQVATWGLGRMARFYGALAPILTPDQRTKVADKLRAHASAM
jgi:Spy/CpxP family protein refolding chaperone